uniref:Uncharacterized protein n=1 Tax=Rhizophora mucronata TaxID=61149 RepID=A0A2P2P934_RHIMU
MSVIKACLEKFCTTGAGQRVSLAKSRVLSVKEY